MTAEIISFAKWVEDHKPVKVEVEFDPFWALRLWLAFFKVR